MNPVKIILGLVPFALFALLAGAVPTGWAALIGLVAAIVILAADIRGGVRAVPVVAAITLGTFSVLAFLGGHDVADFLGIYGRGLATFVLAVYILITAGFAPFTASYARETTPKQYWASSTFIALNRRISLAWGGTVMVMAVSHVIASAIASTGATAPVIVAAFNWGLPVLAIVMTVKYTNRTIGAGTATQRADA